MCEAHRKCSADVYSEELESTGQMWAHPSLTPGVALRTLPPPSVLPRPLFHQTVASVGWKPQSGNLAKGRWGTPSSAALLRVGWFLFLSWPVRCGAVGRVQGPPVLEGPGRRSCGPTRVRVRKTEALLVRQGLVCLEDGSRLRLCKQVIVQTHPHV